MILVCGEALYDLFGTPGEEGGADMRFEGRMGGSPFNVAIGMARLGAPVGLFTGVSTDAMGARLADALDGEGVDTRHLIRSGRRTTLSVVGIDVNGHPDYAFYGVGSADCSIGEADLPTLGPEVTGLHLGSYSIVVEPVASALAALAEREDHRFLSLDPNIRPTVEADMDVWRARVDALRRHADLVKVSEEDLAALHPGETPEDCAARWSREGPALVVLTRGGGDVLALRGGDAIRVTPPTVRVVDTVGAGDAFMAALLAALADHADPRGWIEAAPTDALAALLARAARAAAIACTRRGADLPRKEDIETLETTTGRET